MVDRTLFESVRVSALDDLARQLGIEGCFRDARGQIRETSHKTKMRLLSAMGVSADDERAAAAALKQMDDDAWRRSLPPVCVVSTEKVEIECVVPEGTTEFAWAVAFEDQSERGGNSRCDEATRVARYALEGRRLERHRVELEGQATCGYHRLRSPLDGAECSLIVTPGQCWLPPAVAERRRLWGVAAQVYLLRSANNWGIGDFTDVRRLIEIVDARGGQVIGLNPLHAMFLDNPQHASPYSPESRILLNVLNIDIEAVPELINSPETRQLLGSTEFQRKLSECRAATLVDYAGVAALKLQVLRLLFDCCKNAPDPARWQAFEAFRAERGDPFERNCLYEALREHFAQISGELADWHAWPADYRDARSPAVRRFAEENASQVTLHAWMQWLADQQLEAAAAAAGNMEIGLYRDLAVGTDPSGAATWNHPDAVVAGASVGAPPDIYNAAGQDWGLPPFHPRALFDTGYREFIDLVRANMRHAGGLRIDHVMALQHLYWVPNGHTPSEGAYVQYPLADLVGILALESHRNRCVVVGEDLGTVPEGFRERMAAGNILSYRVLFFEQDSESGDFLPPQGYPRLALAVTGSHDLPTVRAWWEGSDIDLREKLKLFPERNGASNARSQREREKRGLLKALQRERLMGEAPRDDSPEYTDEVIVAAHAYLARSGALIAMMQLDDITAEKDPVNVPATSEEHPNWRRRLSLTLEELSTHPRFERLARVFQEERR